jgi:hypothetical protein
MCHGHPHWQRWCTPVAPSDLLPTAAYIQQPPPQCGVTLAPCASICYRPRRSGVLRRRREALPSLLCGVRGTPASRSTRAGSAADRDSIILTMPAASVFLPARLDRPRQLLPMRLVQSPSLWLSLPSHYRQLFGDTRCKYDGVAEHCANSDCPCQ